MGRPNEYPDQFRNDVLELVKTSQRAIADVARSLGIAKAELVDPFGSSHFDGLVDDVSARSGGGPCLVVKGLAHRIRSFVSRVAAIVMA
jgi:hypothetical protein